MRLFINNLPKDFSSNDLKEMFLSYGTVISAKIVTDADSGESRGFGFVEMSSFHEGESAIKELNGQEIKDKIILVETARSK